MNLLERYKVFCLVNQQTTLSVVFFFLFLDQTLKNDKIGISQSNRPFNVLGSLHSITAFSSVFVMNSQDLWREVCAHTMTALLPWAKLSLVCVYNCFFPNRKE